MPVYEVPRTNVFAHPRKEASVQVSHLDLAGGALSGLGNLGNPMAAMVMMLAAQQQAAAAEKKRKADAAAKAAAAEEARKKAAAAEAARKAEVARLAEEAAKNRLAAEAAAREAAAGRGFLDKSKWYLAGGGVAIGALALIVFMGKGKKRRS